MKKLAPFFFILLIVLSCSDKKKVPKGILPPPKMQEVLWDMISAGEFLNGYVFARDSVDRMGEGSKRYGQVLQFHDLTREEFDKSYRYYRQHPELMKMMLDSLSKRVVNPEDIYKPKADTVQQVDTVKKIDTVKRVDLIKRIDTVKRDSLKKNLKKRMLKKFVAH